MKISVISVMSGRSMGMLRRKLNDQPNSTLHMVNRTEGGWTLERTIESGASRCMFNHISDNENISIGNAAGAIGIIS
jgi:hypothetical protein